MSGMKEHIPGTAEHRATHPPGTGVASQVKSHVPGTAEHSATHGTGASYAGTGTGAGYAGTGTGTNSMTGERYAGEGYEKTAYPYGAGGATGAYEGAGAMPTAGMGAAGAGYAPQVAPTVPVEGEPYPVEPAAGHIGTTTSTAPVGATTGATYETYEGEGARGAYTGGAGTAGTAQRVGRTVETASGDVHEHRTKTGAAMDQAWQKTKEVMPGTKEHTAAQGTTGQYHKGTF